METRHSSRIRWTLIVIAVVIVVACGWVIDRDAIEAATKPQTTASSAMLAAATAAKATGCSTAIASHVYKPTRLTVYSKCITVTGTIVDATAGKRKDGVRKEADGDTHGWLKVDPAFKALLNSGNMSNEGGNLVYEIVCFWPPSQADAISACPSSYANGVQLLPVGTHVAMTGQFVRDDNHAHWNELHPVSAIVRRP